VPWLEPELEVDANELGEDDGDWVNKVEEDDPVSLKDHIIIRIISAVIGHAHPSIKGSSHTMLSTMYLERNGFTYPNLFMVHLVHINIR
jgi:hypothetical protein